MVVLQAVLTVVSLLRLLSTVYIAHAKTEDRHSVQLWGQTWHYRDSACCGSEHLLTQTEVQECLWESQVYAAQHTTHAVLRGSQDLGCSLIPQEFIVLLGGVTHVVLL